MDHDTIQAVESTVAEVDTSALTLDSRAGVVEAMKAIALDKKAKPMEKLRALDKIAELKGFKIDRQIKDLRYVPTKELNDLIANLVMPTLAVFGIEDGTPKLLHAADSKATD